MLLPECRGAESLIITSRAWKLGGYKIVFPSDGEGEGRLIGELGKEKFYEEGTSHRVERNHVKDEHAFHGTGISQGEIKMSGTEEILPCGETFYWMAIDPSNGKAPFPKIIYPESGLVEIDMPDFPRTKYLEVGFISKERFERRADSPQTPAEYQSIGIGQGSLTHYSERARLKTYGSICGTNYGHAVARNLVKKDSIKIISSELLRTEYTTYVTIRDEYEEIVAKRMSQPLSGELLEPYLSEPIEHNLSAPSKEFDFYIEERSDNVIVYRKNIITEEETFLTSFRSDYGLPLPEYSYSCETKECPKGTWEVERGNTICCYGDDGNAVKSFKK